MPWTKKNFGSTARCSRDQRNKFNFEEGSCTSTSGGANLDIIMDNVENFVITRDRAGEEGHKYHGIHVTIMVYRKSGNTAGLCVECNEIVRRNFLGDNGRDNI